LSALITTLKDAHSSGEALTPSLISYVFFPLSTVLRRNSSSAIPDQVLEKLFIALQILCESWWWDIDLRTWEQIFMLCGSVIGGIEGKGKDKDRDDETKEAAAGCLLSLMHGPESASRASEDQSRNSNLSRLKEHVQTPQFTPIFGQTLTSVMDAAASPYMPLQDICLQLLHVMVQQYAPDYFVPSILPGIVSAMTKIALGVSTHKGWSNGNIVARSLNVMQEIIIRSVGDGICAKEGAVRTIDDLEDLVELYTVSSDTPSNPKDPRPYSTTRTPAWLRGTSSQLHIAINSLTPLISHPTSSALLALATFSASVLGATTLTLPQTQPLLLTFLLSLSNSSSESVSQHSLTSLVDLLSSSPKTNDLLMQTLVTITGDNLSALPRLLPSHSDAKVEHVAGLIEAVCKLTIYEFANHDRRLLNLTSISSGIGKLLGPTGGIEKWGWALLYVLEFEQPGITLSTASAAQLMLEVDSSGTDCILFPELTLKHVASRSAHVALVSMFRALGKAGGEECLYAVEWFVGVGRGSCTNDSVAALWCACRLLEGVCGISLDTSAGGQITSRSKRVEKVARSLARNIAELWDEMDDEQAFAEQPPDSHDGYSNTLIEHKKGLLSIRATVDIKAEYPQKQRKPVVPLTLHRIVSLHLLSITSGILQARFSTLFLRVLYPILHSIVSPDSHLSSTALAALNYVTNSTSYATPANLLLSNFDYALDSISRRLTRRWLDVDATRVLVLLVRLVGKDVVQKAGDVVEECFDRLDEYHGYQVLVEGLVEVLSEVVKVVGEGEDARTGKEKDVQEAKGRNDESQFNQFFHWFEHSHDTPEVEEDTSYGPAPREAWGQEETQEEGNDTTGDAPDPTGETSPATPTQLLTKQIVSRSIYFLTHSSPSIRARILTLLSAAVPVLPAVSLLPSIHQAWPFVLNRLGDSESFVVSAAAGLVESLAINVGEFMYRRVWDDVWPRFCTILAKLDIGDKSSALSRRGFEGAIGTETAYTHSHRLYRSVLRTMIAAARDVQGQDSSLWEVMLAFRRFLNNGVHEELQMCARELYVEIGHNNSDSVWLVLDGTAGRLENGQILMWMNEKWDIRDNVDRIFDMIDKMQDVDTAVGAQV
jgi:hypothetical protein